VYFNRNPVDGVGKGIEEMSEMFRDRGGEIDLPAAE